MSEEYNPRYKWAHTWPGQADDFSGMDPATGKRFGRFYRHLQSGGLRWFWILSHPDLRDEFSNISGTADGPREAARKLEAAYDRAKAEGWLNSD